MNPRAIEMAKANVDIYAEVQSPVYEAARQLLVGQLATRGIDQLEELKQQDEMARHNFDLVISFMSTLPSTRYNGRSNYRMAIPVADAYQASQVQANTLWLQDRLFDDPVWSEPHYIIGNRPYATGRYAKGSHSAMQLLLRPAVSGVGADTNIKVVTVWEEEFQLARQIAQAPMSRGYTDAQMTNMFNTDYKRLEILAMGGSMRTSGPLRLGEALPKPPHSKKMLDKVLHAGISVDYGTSLPRGRISDQALAEFDVFTHLNRLATAFDKTDDLKLLFDRYQLRLEHNMPPSSRYA